jgi:hypothetical protein
MGDSLLLEFFLNRKSSQHRWLILIHGKSLTKNVLASFWAIFLTHSVTLTATHWCEHYARAHACATIEREGQRRKMFPIFFQHN